MAVRVKMNDEGVRELLRSPEVLADLERRAAAISEAAGGAEAGFEVDSERGTNRARASVRTVTRQAMLAEAKDRRLTRAVEAGRG